MKRMMKYCVGIGMAVGMAAMAVADVVTLKSGDRLTGKITGGDSGSLKFASDAAGDIALKVGDIAEIVATSELPVALKDGTTATVTISASQGQMQLTGIETGAPIRLDDVDAINPAGTTRSFSIIASYVANRGNTFSDVASLTADALYQTKVHRAYAALGYAYGRQRDTATETTTTSVKSWYAKAQYDYFVTSKLYLYANAKYEQDRIAELKGRETVGTGVGYQWVDTGTFGFKTECGVTYYHEEMENGTARDVASIRFAYGTYQKIGEAIYAFHNVEYLPDVTDWSLYLINADAGVRVKMTANFLWEAKAEWRHNSRPLLEGSKRLDSRYTLGLGYTF